MSSELAKVERKDCVRCDNKREFKCVQRIGHDERGRTSFWGLVTIPCPSCTETERLKDLRERAATSVEALGGPHLIAARIRALPL